MRMGTIVAAGFLSLADHGAVAEQLAGDALRRAISGKQLFLATPFGGEFPLTYRPSGDVDGSGKAIGLGRFMQPTDSGKWWVDGPRVCQQWKTWYDGKPFCFTVELKGSKELAWVRDDGLKGTARIVP
jgi:hypothetical protein